MKRTITKKYFDEQRVKLAKELAHAREQLEHFEGNLGIPNRIRDAEISSWEFQIRCLEKDRDELWDTPIKG